jgi:hypothetical protein
MRPHPLDADSLDRLLSGRTAPDDAPPGLVPVAELFRAASGPATREELGREGEIVAAGAAAVRASSVPTPCPRRRSPMLAKLLSAKFAAAAAVAALGAGTAAAAATGSLPTQSSHASPHAAKGLATAEAHQTTTTAPAGTGGAPNSHDTFGLCTAYLAHGSGSGPSASAPPFQALVAAHGGASGTATYCQAVVAAHHPGAAPTSTTPPSTTAEPNTGTEPTTATEPTTGPATNGSGAREGAPVNPGPPATAGSSASHAPVVTPNRGGTGTANSASGGASGAGTSRAGTVGSAASSAGSGNASGHP